MNGKAHLGPSHRSARRARIAICLLILIGFGVVASVATPIFATETNGSLSSNPQSKAPARTPVPGAPVAGRPPLVQPVVDANTVALYHFDTDASDATGLHNGTFAGNAHITSAGLYGGALSLDGAYSYVRLGNLGALPQGTIEAFIDFSTACYNASSVFSILGAGPEFSSGASPTFLLGVDGMLDFSIWTPGGWRTVTSGINPCRYLDGVGDKWPYFNYMTPPPANLWPYEAWRFHHVAGTWGPRGIEIWVDGVLHGVGTMPYGVYCNPQAQVTSFSYPNCDSPNVAATPYGLFTYTDGMAPYNTFLIGCDSAQSCFKGRIDELRISNIQRTFTYTIDPSPTPLPTATGVPLNGAYAPDAYTVLLHHFDSWDWMGAARIVYDSASPAHNGLLSDRASVVAGGKFASALVLDGSGGYSQMWNLGTTPSGTIEAWFYPVNTANYAIVSQGSTYGWGRNNLYLGPGPACGGAICFGIVDANNQWHWVNSNILPSSLLYSWHHVAGTWGTERGMEIWVDGIRRGTLSSFTGHRSWDPSYDYTFAGCDSAGACLSGVIDELRISSIQRTFAPMPANTPMPSPTVTPTLYWDNLPNVKR